MADPSDLTPLDRARRFRLLAVQAARDAERTQGAIREGYLLLERGWRQLAEDIAAAEKRGSDHNGLPKRDAALRPPKEKD